MPIIQSRVIAIVNAGLDYQQALIKATEGIRTAGARARAYGGDPKAELEQLETMFGAVAYLLNEPGDSPATLALEAAYFRRFGKRNESAKRYQRKRRHGDESIVLPNKTPAPPAVGFGGRLETEEEKLMREMGVEPARARAAGADVRREIANAEAARTREDVRADIEARDLTVEAESESEAESENEIGPDVEIE